LPGLAWRRIILFQNRYTLLCQLVTTSKQVDTYIVVIEVRLKCVLMYSWSRKSQFVIYKCLDFIPCNLQIMKAKLYRDNIFSYSCAPSNRDSKSRSSVPGAHAMTTSAASFRHAQLEKMYQLTTKYTKSPQHIPNHHNIYEITTTYIYQITTKYTKSPYIKYTKSPQNVPIHHKIYHTAIKHTKFL
jgi:hypothetical protein